MPTILDARAIITGEDRSGAAFASFEKKVAGLSRSVGAVNRVSGSLSSLSNVVASRKMVDGLSNFEEKMAGAQIIDGMSRMGVAAEVASRKLSMLQRTMGGMKSAASSAWKNIGPFAEGAAGMGLLHETKRALEAGATLQGERILMKTAGIPQAEISAEQKQAFELSTKYPNMTPAEIMQSYKETRSVVLKPSETAGLMDTVVAAKSAMKQLGMGEETANALQFAVKSAEVLGRAQDPKRFRAYIDSFIRALEVSGKTLTPEDMFRFSQQMKGAGATLSDRFINTVGMSMIQDMGSRAATGLAQFSKMMVGGYSQGQKRSLTEMYHLGMVDRRDLEFGKDGIKGMRPGRHVKNWRLALTDPDKYVNDYLIPTLKKHGYTSLEDQIAETYRLFPNQQAGNVVAKLIQQQLSFEQHAVNYERSLGLAGASVLLHENAIASLDALKTSIQTFGSAVTDPLMEPAAGKLFRMATSIASFGRAIDNFDTVNPLGGRFLGGGAVLGATALGGLGVYKMFSGFMGGFGLKTSASALDASAAALTEAAAKLGASSVLRAPIPSPSSGKIGGPGALRTGIFAFNLLGAAWGMPSTKEEFEAQGKTVEKESASFDKWWDAHTPWWLSTHAHEDLAKKWDEWESPSDKGLSDAGHIGTDIASQLSVIADRPVHGDVEVTVGGTSKIELSDNAKRFLDLMDDLSISAKASLRSKGNTGVSMPEAFPDRGAR